jgi:kumamolisin
MQVTVVLRPRRALPSLAELSSGQRSARSRAEIEADHAAAPEDIQRVEDFARARGLEIVESSSARRSVILFGSPDQIRAAFGTDPAQIPPELQPAATAVLGLSTRPVARPRQ